MPDGRMSQFETDDQCPADGKRHDWKETWTGSWCQKCDQRFYRDAHKRLTSYALLGAMFQERHERS